ncbi:hypothetical protein BKA81DRAFT_417111 [Phyllosticta paracitricarpa]|uniref:UBC core domain-containing protein n=1 Tax=Phyllosticta paracitricarpa TaxID=2016321 RepID=A0ABR1N190_9PEZI
MPRRAYNADLHAVIDSQDNSEGISAVRRGDDDGFIDFDFVPPSGGRFLVTAMVSDVSDYPSSHNYFLVVGDTTPPEFANPLARAGESLQPGLSIRGLLDHLSRFFYGDDSGSLPSDVGDSEATDDDEDNVFEEDPSFFEFDDDDSPSRHFKPEALSESTLSLEDRNKIRGDLRLVKQAGFRVGGFPSLLQGQPTYLSISCKVKRLGISEEAMQAWGIAPEDYLILLIQYPQGYKGLEGRETSHIPLKTSMEFRTGIGTSYKPTANEICKAFSSSGLRDRSNQDTGGFREHFISEAMHHLLNDTFIMLFKCRLLGMSWDGATLFYHDHQGAVGLHADSVLALQDPKYRCENAPNNAFPDIVTADHVNERSQLRPSLPLVAMQFLVRNFVRSPDYCLICHRRMPHGLEALKPYVCDIPLCLFQYMQMGLGPRIEHEIMTQPKVVDLLVTLCYCSAKIQSLDSNHLPKGLGLRIPPLSVLRYAQTSTVTKPSDGASDVKVANKTQGLPAHERSMDVRVNIDRREMTFPNAMSRSKLGIKNGDWVAFKLHSRAEILHAKVQDTIHAPNIRLSKPIVMPLTSLQSSVMSLENPEKTPSISMPSGSLDASIWLYTTDCDSLEEQEMREAIWLLLEMLPSIEEMKQYLKQTGSDLKSWSDRIPPPVLGLLRWIIASNRACIMQIDLPDGSGYPDDGRQEAVSGMPGWIQFKFAMGAPDKERRFLQSVGNIKKEMKLSIPTLFAWHGSSLQNWHSIIRDGLNYSRIVNGRAYGNGIYFARDAATSMAYSYRTSAMSVAFDSNSNAGASSVLWPLSSIKPSVILSLNEIVNAPSKFKSHTPYYVVQHLDWTQTRYLFVQQNLQDQWNKEPEKQEPVPTFPLAQDPAVTPRGSTNAFLVIPASKALRNANHAVPFGSKKFKAQGSASDPISIDVDDSASSLATDDEDRELLELEEEPIQEATKLLTDFVPGTLERSRLPAMAPPTGDAASGMATKRLQSDYRSVLKLQDSSPLHELGWYIDPEVIMETGNIYQWIVELHSFDPLIPLAKDMKSRGIKSIVLEIRFGKEYPMSPPFVRVIRPCFLSFLEGGGGHVTAGGALCMELLTNSGWSAVSTIEAVLMQVRLAMSSTDPRPARLAQGHKGEYSVGEAVEAYKRACQRHGWEVPKGFDAMMMGS